MRRPTLVLAVATLLLVAGCVATTGPGTGPDDTDPRGTTTTTTTTPTTTTPDTTTTTPTTTTPATTTTTEDPGYGTQFLYVDRLDDQSDYREFDPAERAQFGNLSAARQEAFLRALEDGRVTYGPDEENPFDWNDEDRPRVVKYEGSWYEVTVAIV